VSEEVDAKSAATPTPSCATVALVPAHKRARALSRDLGDNDRPSGHQKALLSIQNSNLLVTRILHKVCQSQLF
jgi:hypothetical protein